MSKLEIIVSGQKPHWPFFAGLGAGIIATFLLMASAFDGLMSDRIGRGHFEHDGVQYRIQRWQ